MNFPLVSEIARSLLLARWKQTLVAAIGVTFSITMFIALLGFMNGLNDMLDGLVSNRTAHVRLFTEPKPPSQQPVNIAEDFRSGYNFIRSIKSSNDRTEIRNSRSIIQAIRADKRVVGLAPRISAQVFFNEGTTDITGVINGVDAPEETRLYHFNDYVTSGKPMDLSVVTNSIILGKALAERLKASIGDVIQATTPQGERFPLRVVGLYQSGIQEYDKNQSFASLVTTQKVLGKPASYLTDLHVKLFDLKSAPGVAREYAHLFDIDAEDIQTANAQFETGSFIRSLISYAVGITLLIVAGFGIYNILNMLIYEKMDSIAILKATGFSGSDVHAIFLIIALTIGFSGGMVGLLFGFILSMIIDRVPFVTPALPTITTYPVNYDLIYYLIGISFSLITTFFAGIFPANKASRIDPVVIIRGK